MRRSITALLLLMLYGFTSGYAVYGEEKAKEGNSAERVLKTVVSIKNAGKPKRAA